MQLKSNKMFPYPLLWEEKDDYVNNGAFKVNVSHYDFAQKTILDIECVLDDDELHDLVSRENVEILCHIECPKTKFRSVYPIVIGKNEVSIESNKLNGKVEIVAVLQNKKELLQYRNKNFNEYYGKIKFDIPAYSIIGISSHFAIHIEKDIDSLANISSIVSIIPCDDNEKAMQVSCENSAKIYIKLPAKSYSKYVSLAKVDKWNPVIFSMIIIPAMIIVFKYLIDQDDLDMFEDYRWFRGLTKVVNSIKGAHMSLEYLKKADLFVLAQAIVGQPINDAFSIITDTK